MKSYNLSSISSYNNSTSNFSRVAISLSIGNNGIISRGELTAEGNKLASYKEKLEMYKAEK